MTSKKLLIPSLLLLMFFAACSSSVDTSQFDSEGYFNYAMQLYNDEDYEAALKQFQNIILQYPGSAVYDDAQYYLGLTYYQREQYLLAAYEFSKLIRNIPASTFVPEAQFKLGDCYYKLSPPYQLDQTYTQKAIDEYQAFIDYFPSDPKVEEADSRIKELNDKLAEKEYQSGVIYQRMGYEIAALKYFGNVVNVYHDTKYAPMALYRKIKLEIDRNMKTEAYDDINTFSGRYPDDPNAEELKSLEPGLTKK